MNAAAPPVRMQPHATTRSTSTPVLVCQGMLESTVKQVCGYTNLKQDKAANSVAWVKDNCGSTIISVVYLYVSIMEMSLWGDMKNRLGLKDKRGDE